MKNESISSKLPTNNSNRKLMMLLQLVLAKRILTIGNKETLTTKPHIVDLENVMYKSLRSGGSVIAKDAEIRFAVSGEVTFEMPVIFSLPSAVIA